MIRWHQMIRVIDESGEDYLYPEERFIRIELSQPAASAAAAGTPLVCDGGLT